MTIKALSIVSPYGTLIASGEKTIETRTWPPDLGRNEWLVLIENHRRLTLPDEVDPDGLAIAVVRIGAVAPWTVEQEEAACFPFQPGLLGWEIAEVRRIAEPFRMPAGRRIYEVEVAAEWLPLEAR